MENDIQLTQEELDLANMLSRLFKSGHIKIGVNIEPEYAMYGSGRWNITKTYAMIGNQYFELDTGSVEIIEGI